VISRRLLAGLFAAVVLLVHGASGRALGGPGSELPGLDAAPQLAVATGECAFVRTPAAPRPGVRLGHGPQLLLATLPLAPALSPPTACGSCAGGHPVARRPALLAWGRSSRGPPAVCPG
jgi:hypothetical protein